MSKILVTGGLGFVGSRVGLALIHLGYTVYLLDNLSRGGSDQRVKLFQGHELKCKLVIGDVEDIRNLISECDFEYVIHCAAQVAVTTSLTNPELDFSTNALGTLRLLEWIRISNTGAFKKIIYSSTNKVYGDLGDLGLSEVGSRYVCTDGKNDYSISETREASPRTPYGLSKYTGEMLVAEWSRSFGISGVVLRKSCIYGEGQMGIVDQGWVSYISKCIVNSGRVEIFGDGKQVRDLLNVDDLVDLYIRIITSSELGNFSIFNVGGGFGNSYSVLEFIEYVSSKLKIDVTMVFSPWRSDDQRYYVSDITSVCRTFQWRPIRTIDTLF